MQQSKQLRYLILLVGLINIAIYYVISLRFISLMPLPITSLSKFYLVMLVIGHCALYGFVLIAAIPLVLTLCKPYGWRFWLIYIFLIAGSTQGLVLLFSDSFVYELFHWHINYICFQFFFSGKVDEIADFGWQEELALYGSITLVVLFEAGLIALLWRWLRKKASFNFKTGFWLYTVMAFCLMMALVLHMWAYATYYKPIINGANMLPYTLQPNANTVLMKLGVLDEKKVSQYPFQLPFITWFKTFNYPLHPLTTAPHKQYNILFLFVDTLRYDMVTKQTMPNTWQFAQQSLQFTQHFSGGDCTQPGVFSLFYGLPPTYWSAALHHPQGPVLIQALNQQGYQIGIYNSAPLDAPNFAGALFPSVSHLQINTTGNSVWQRDEMITTQLINFMKQSQQAKKPFFGYVFYDAVHAYSMPPEFPVKYQPRLRSVNRLALNNQFDPVPFKNLYMDSVVFDDAMLGKVLDTAKQLGLLKNTIIVITSDHGEQFNEYHNDYWGHGTGYSKYQIQTPFIVYWPGMKPRQINYVTTHYDLVPTLMQKALGINNPMTDYSIGYSLFDNTPRQFFIVGSYGHTAVVHDDVVTNFFPDSGYQVTDREMTPIISEPFDRDTMLAAKEQTDRFFTH